MATESGDSSATDPNFEHPVSPATRKRLHACYERGQQLARGGDHDYAHEMFSQCVAADPGNLVYVDALLDNLQVKYQQNRKGARFKGLSRRGSIKRAAAAEDWSEVIRIGINYLRVNPWDVATLRPMAMACQHLHFNEVELRYLKNALDGKPKDIEVNRHCARSLARMGQFDQAIACWHRVEELAKGNEEAPRMISQLTTEKTRCGGVDVEDLTKEQDPTVDSAPSVASRIDVSKLPRSPSKIPKERGRVVPPEKAASPDPELAKPIPLNERQLLEKAVRDNPEQIDGYLRLADHYTNHGDFRRATEVLTRGLSASGNDLNVREKLEESQMQEARARVAIAEERAKSEPSDDAKSLVKQLRNEQHRLELEIYSLRAQRYPDSKPVQFELGVRLKRVGNADQALRCLEIARKEAMLEADSLLELGECFQQKRHYQKALDCYLRAIESFDHREEPSTSDRLHLVLYRAGVLAAGLGSVQDATKCLNRLTDLVPDYRDARSRLDKLRQIGND